MQTQRDSRFRLKNDQKLSNSSVNRKNNYRQHCNALYCTVLYKASIAAYKLQTL